MIQALSSSSHPTVICKVNKIEQLEVVKEGAVITLRNANSNVHNEHIRVEVDRWGKVEACKEKVNSINEAFDVSAEAYELAEKPSGGNRRGGRRGGRGRGNY